MEELCPGAAEESQNTLVHQINGELCLGTGSDGPNTPCCGAKRQRDRQSWLFIPAKGLFYLCQLKDPKIDKNGN